VPPPLPNQYVGYDEVLPAEAKLRPWLRTLLALMAGFLIAVFTIAIWLNPYNAEGEALRLETHRQLGLPECNFKWLTGKPCPSCGMTTSFALFVRCDFWNSLAANCVGTMLAVFCLLLIPYGLITALRGQYWMWISVDWLVPRLVVVFCAAMLIRWGLVLWLG